MLIYHNQAGLPGCGLCLKCCQSMPPHVNSVTSMHGRAETGDCKLPAEHSQDWAYLQVSIHNVFGMTVVHAIDELLEEPARLPLLQATSLLDVVPEVATLGRTDGLSPHTSD